MKIRIAFWRGFYFIINPLRRLYWGIFRPRTRGVKVLAEHKGRYVFVRLAYGGKYWTLPGGGVYKDESFAEAARRELHEETGLESGPLRLLGQYETNREGKQDTVQCFACNPVSIEVKNDPVEISEVRWLCRTEIPADHAKSVDKTFAFYDQDGSHSL